MNLPSGYKLQNGKYQLTQVIGQGGFGITYKGVWFTEVKGNLGTVPTEVPVCIKEYFFKAYCDRNPENQAIIVYSETGKQFFDKFKEKQIKEATILSEVHHPHIVNVLEVFEENNTAYIAMEYISGSSLKQLLDKEGVLPEKDVLRYIAQIGSALDFVHRNHILHLDIKPSNILIDKKGAARLIDFGVSKRYDLDQQETSTTLLTLSKGFASIEQYDGEGTQSFSPCPDIYSLGATMYNLLTGKIPVESILRVTKPLQNPMELNPGISERTARVILKAMELKATDRYKSVEEMIADLGLPPEKQVALQPPSRFEPSSHPSKKSKESKGKQDSDESTILYIPEKTETDIRSRKKSKKKAKEALLFSLLLIAVGASSIIVLHNYHSVPKQNTILAETRKTDLPKPAPNEEAGISSPALKEQTAEAPAEEKQEDKSKKTETETASLLKKVTSEKPSVPLVEMEVNPGKEVNKEAATPTAEEIQNNYNKFLSSGKEKMEEKDYAGAKKDFLAAKDALLTEEIVRLLIDTDAKIEESRIADRKAGYELKRSFGPYMIVRKKENLKYGAIDNKGNEVIPCKYRNVGIVKNGRAFEREDNLFDIYNTDGKLVSEAQTSYY